MGSKVKCPGCGAKNDGSSYRCRICTAVINPDALEEALHVRVAALGEHGGDGRVGSGELAPEIAEVRQLVLVVLVEHASRRQSTAPSGRCQ